MSDTVKYWEEQDFGQEENKEEQSKNVKLIIELFNLLSPSEKVEVKKIIRSSSVF